MNPHPIVSRATHWLLFSAGVLLAPQLSAQPADGAAAGEMLVLQPFAVVSSKGSGYIAGAATVGSRVNQSLLDIPQTVNVLTADFLQDTNTFNLDQLFMHVSGVHARNGSLADTSAPGAYLLRGFENNSNYVEGVAVPGYRRDMVGYDRVEVIKGVPSVALGRGDASGSINYVYKKPNLDRESGSVRVLAGSHSFYRGEIDWNQPITTAKLGYRLVAAIEKSKAYVVEETPDDLTLYRFFPSIRFSPTEATTILINGEYLRTEAPMAAYGRGFTLMPAKFRRLFDDIGAANNPITSLNLPWGFHLGPGEVTDDTTKTTLSVSHRFNEHVDVRQIASYVSVSQDESHYFSGGNTPDANPADPTNAQGIYKVMNYRESHYFERRWSALGDIALNFTPSLGGISLESTTMAGYSLTQGLNDRTLRQYIPLGTFRYLNLNNWNFASIGRDAPINRNEANTLRTRTLDDRQAFSYYIEQRLSAWNGKLAAVYGWRDTTQTGSFTNYLATVNPRTSNNSKPPASTRFGLFYSPTSNLSLYASRSDQTDPAISQFQWTDLNPGDSRSQPILTGTPAVVSMEIGAKGYLLNRRLYFSLAYYKLERQDTLTSITRVNTESPIGSGQFVVAREFFLTTGDESKGWELELIGSLTKELTLSSSFGMGDTKRKVPTAANPNASRTLDFVPDWDANLFAKYDLRKNRNGFIFTAGANFLGPIQAYNLGGTFGTNGTGFGPTNRTQHIFNASVGYSWDHGRYMVNVRGSNLSDDTYMIVRVNEPRAVRVSFAMDF